MSNLLDRASILLTPTSVSQHRIHSVKPIQTFGSELVTNGSYDADSNWNGSGGYPNNGWAISNGVANFDTNDGTGNFSQTSIHTVGKQYVLDCDAEITSGRLKYEPPTGANPNVGDLSVAEIFSGKNRIYYTAETTAAIFRRINTPSVGFIDNVSIRETIDGDFDFTRATTATRVNSSGLIESVASGLPRIDFLGGTGQILLEPASTNIALNSNDLTNSSWSKFNATASTSTIVNPEGTSGASLYTCDDFTGSNQFFRINPNTVYTSDANFTYSMFVKYNTFQFCRLSYVKFSPAVHFAAVFDILNGTVTATDSDGTPQNTSSKIENFGNGWFRISISAAISSSSGNAMNFEFNKSPSGTPTFINFGRTEQTTTTNDKVYVYGVQLEQQSFATSYIPTSSGTVTRNKDEANSSGDTSLISSTEGVLYAEIAAFRTTGVFESISISDGTVDNNIRFFINNSENAPKVQIKTGGVSQAVISGTVTDVTAFNKLAIRYKNNDCDYFINGVLVGTDTSVTIPSGLDSLSFSAGTAAGSPYEGKVKSVAVFKEFLDNDELECLTGSGFDSFTALAEAGSYTII